MAELPDSQRGNNACQQEAADRGEQERHAERQRPISREE
jgi:hypothetical protein